MRYLMTAVLSALIGLGGASAAQLHLHKSTRTAAMARVPAKCWGVTMHLEPGVQKPAGFPSNGWIGHGWEIAKNIPLDAVTAEAPLYPGAVPSRAALSQNVFWDFRGSNYIKTAAAEFSLPIGAGTALSWYRKTFPACGLTAREYSTYAVHFTDSPTTPSLDVLVSLEPVSAHSSLVLYYASAISGPLRSARSYIKDGGAGVTGATVTYSVTGSKAVRITLRNPSVIQGLAAVIGPAPLIALTGCLFRAEAGSAVVVFHQPGGAAQRLVVSPDCYFTANGSGRISDVDHPVWSYVSYLVYKHCFQYGCPTLR